tara:strand:- start:226 stop:630 length:405 start_codon:yes stop_codon:yes gene_type:complete
MGPFVPGMSLGNMQGIGGPIPGMLGGPVEGLKDRFMQQSEDRAREASMEMQRRLNEEAERRALEQVRDMRRQPQFDTFQRGPINMMHSNPFGGGAGMGGGMILPSPQHQVGGPTRTRGANFEDMLNQFRSYQGR